MAEAQRLGTTELLFRQAKQMGLRPAWITAQGVFAVQMPSGIERYINSAHSPLNSQVAASLAKDKHLTRLVLARHKLPNIPFAMPATVAQAKAFLAMHGKVVAKPTHGHGSQDVHVIVRASQLDTLSVEKYIFEKYITGAEMRYLVIGDEVVSVYRSDYGTSVAAGRYLECVTFPEDAWDKQLGTLSVRIAKILGLQFAAVDYLVDAAGQSHILEVNSTPDLKWFHMPTAGPSVDVAMLFLEAMLREDKRSQAGATSTQRGEA